VAAHDSDGLPARESGAMTRLYWIPVAIAVSVVCAPVLIVFAAFLSARRAPPRAQVLR
jgi:hypothetical protein